MFSRRRFAQCFVFAVASLLTACGGSEAKTASAPKTVEDRFPIKLGDQIVQLQIAVLPAEMQKGLMFRKTMDEDEGMIFVFDRPQQLGFWMRNTELPLDIGYFDVAGELKEIYPMYPRDERSVSSRSRSLQFAVEMNQGWYSRHGVKSGAKLDLNALAAAIKARGLRPETLGLARE